MGSVPSSLGSFFVNERPDPVKEPFINRVPLPDDTDDIDRRRGPSLDLFFFLSFLSSSDDESEPDGGGHKEAITTDSLADMAASDFTTFTANFVIEAKTAGLLTIDSTILSTTFLLVSNRTIAVSNDYLILDSSSRIDIRRLISALRSVHLMKALL